MKTLLIQQDILWAEPLANVGRLDGLFDIFYAGEELVVLPEMFSTGFVTCSPRSAEMLDGEGGCPTLEWMRRKAAALGCAIAGSVAVTDGERCFNRLYFVKPDGSVSGYDKRHLFNYGGEGEYFTSGRERVVVEWKGVRFLLAVCYDLRFPVWLRNRDDYDAVICVANWPTVRRLAWDTLTRARAIENQCWFLAVNRVGKDPVCEYDGGTFLYNPYGEVMAACENGSETAVSGEIDMKMLEAYRAKFPVLEDADGFDIV